MYVVWFVYHQNDVNVGGFDYKVADPNGMKSLCSSYTAFCNRFTQGIGKKQKPLFKTNCAE